MRGDDDTFATTEEHPSLLSMFPFDEDDDFFGPLRTDLFHPLRAGTGGTFEGLEDLVDSVPIGSDW